MSGFPPKPASAPAAAAAPERPLKADRTIRVSNLDPAIGEDELRNDVFRDCGLVTSVTVYYDQAGRSLGSSLITFATPEEARRALEEYDGASVDGRIMSVHLQCTLGTAPPVVVKRTPAPAPAAAKPDPRPVKPQSQQPHHATGAVRGYDTQAMGYAPFNAPRHNNNNNRNVGFEVALDSHRDRSRSPAPAPRRAAAPLQRSSPAPKNKVCDD